MGLQQVPNERNRVDEARHFPDWFVLPSCAPPEKMESIYTQPDFSSNGQRDSARDAEEALWKWFQLIKSLRAA